MMPQNQNVTPQNAGDTQKNQEGHTKPDDGEDGDVGQVIDELGNIADQHRGLKTLVLVLGLVIIALFVFVVYAIANRAAEAFLSIEEPQKIAAEQTMTGTAGTASVSGADLTVARPDGGELVSASANGGELVLHFRHTDGSDTVVILDRSSGKQSRVTVKP